MEHQCTKRYRNTQRDDKQTSCIKKRINRIIGQLQGIDRMLEDNRYCGDILLQISAAEKALQQLGFEVLNEHLLSCVTNDIKNGDNSSLEESIKLIRKLK